MSDIIAFTDKICENKIELNSHNSDRTIHELENMVTDIMIEIGVPAHVKGYCYLRTAIMLTVQRPDLIYAMTKELYPAIGDIYLTTAQRVERAIRHAIELAWDNGDMEILARYFSYRIRKSSDKPTNSEFIATLSDKIRVSRNLQ